MLRADLGVDDPPLAADARIDDRHVDRVRRETSGPSRPATIAPARMSCGGIDVRQVDDLRVAD